MRDEELIQRVVQGQPGAFDELYHAYVDRVYRQLAALVGVPSDAEDLVQQTFVQVHKHIAGFRGDAEFSTWLHRIVLNVAWAHLRKRNTHNSKMQTLQQAEVANEIPTPEQSEDHRRLRGMLYGALDRLKPKKRTVFVMYELDGHTLEEIAEVLQAPLHTVAARLRAARVEMRKILQRGGAQESSSEEVRGLS